MGLLRSFVGSFTARSGLSLVEFVGVVLIATIAGPGVLGAYALFRAVFVVISLFIDFGMDEASIKRIAEGKSQGEFLAALIATKAGLLVPVAIAVLLFRAPVARYIGDPITVPFLLVISFLELFAESIYAGLHGEGLVGRAELSLFTNVVGKVLAWIVLLPLGYGLAGLLTGILLGSCLQIVVGFKFLTIQPRVPARRHFESLFRFGRFSWLGAIRERAWIWLDTLILGFFVSSELIGIYEFSWRLSAAFFLVSSAISSTLFANVDRLLREDGLDVVRETLEESLVYTGIVAIPGLVGGVLVAKSLLAVFGPAYSNGYLVLVVLILARLAHSYEIVFAKVINALDRPDLTFRADAVFIVLNVVGNTLAVLAIGWVGAAIATALSMTVRTLLTYRYLHSIMDISVPRREILLEGFSALLMGGALFYFTRGGPLSELELAAAIAGGAALYAGLLLVFVDRIRTHVRTAIAVLV